MRLNKVAQISILISVKQKASRQKLALLLNKHFFRALLKASSSENLKEEIVFCAKANK
jgi:hypothetical protein